MECPFSYCLFHHQEDPLLLPLPEEAIVNYSVYWTVSRLPSDWSGGPGVPLDLCMCLDLSFSLFRNFLAHLNHCLGFGGLHAFMLW